MPSPPTVRLKRVEPAKLLSAFAAKLHAHPRHPEVRKLLADGHPLDHVVGFVKGELGAFADMADATLKSHLGTYRASLPPWERKDLVAGLTTEAVRGEVIGRIDALAEMEELVALQLRRIKKGADVENKIGLLSPQLSREIDLGGVMLGRLEVLRRDLGVGGTPQSAGAADSSPPPATYASDEVQKVMENPERRRKVLNIVEKLAQLSGERGQIVKNLLEGKKAEPADRTDRAKAG